MADVDLRELAVNREPWLSSSTTRIASRKHVLTRYVIPLALIAGFLTLIAWASRDLMFPPKSVTVVPVVTETAEIREGGTPLFRAAGWIEPRPTPVRVAALAPGVVEKLLVVEDQAVRSGEPIAELIRQDAHLAHQRALADLQLREAELDEATAAFVAADTRYRQPVHLEATLSEAEASLAKIDTELKNLPFALRRAESEHWALQRDYDGKASARGVIPAIRIDIAESKVEAAKSLVEELRDRKSSLAKEQAALTARRDALRTQLQLLADEKRARDEAQAGIKAAGARVEQARVAVEEARLQLDRMTIVSPVDGRVFRLIAHPGARLGSGMTQKEGHDGSTVVTMYRPEMLQIRVDVRFEDIPKVSLRQPVEFNNPALSTPLIGDVLLISSEADIQKNTLQVKVAIPDPPSVLKPEMLVDVTFLAKKPPDQASDKAMETRLCVLQKLIHQDQDGSYVWLADQSDGIAKKTAVRIGSAGADGLVEVVGGLTISSRIIASGIDGLRDGDRIRVTGEDMSLGTSSSFQNTGGVPDTNIRKTTGNPTSNEDNQ